MLVRPRDQHPHSMPGGREWCKMESIHNYLPQYCKAKDYTAECPLTYGISVTDYASLKKNKNQEVGKR